MIIKGWPKERRDIPQTIREYWPFSDELTIENGMIIKGNQILIPKHLQPEILKDLHIPHLGIVKTNLLAKSCIYWPRMHKDVQDMKGECSECQTNQRRQTPVAFVNRRLPREPWEALCSRPVRAQQRKLPASRRHLHQISNPKETKKHSQQ